MNACKQAQKVGGKRGGRGGRVGGSLREEEDGERV